MNIKANFVTLLYLLQGIVGFKIVCVYTNWSQYRPDGGKFLPEDVDPTLCTHLIYVYAKLKGNRLAAVEWNDDGTKWAEGMYQRVNNLKDINPEMKTLLGVGGWMMGSKDFSRLAAGRASRKVFARTSVKFLRDRNFDGLSIDWQHPTKRGGRPKDKENFSLLLKEIRKAFDEESKKSGLPPLLLTAGVSASRNIIDTAYEVDNITRYTDFMNVMAYDLHGDWDNYTGHPSQLYARQDEFGPSTEVNVDAAMRYWISLVPDRKKLILGVSTYGRTFTLRKARHHEYNVPTTGPGMAGEFTQQPGMLAYYERCNQYMDAPRVWDPVSQVAYWYSGDQWTAGEDIESVKAKVNWMRYNTIGGIMLSSLDMDDFNGMHCTGEIYPLLHAIHHQLTAPLPPDPHTFLINNKTPAPPPPPPHVIAPESTTFNWLESSSYYYDLLILADYSTTNGPITSNAPRVQPTTTTAVVTKPSMIPATTTPSLETTMRPATSATIAGHIPTSTVEVSKTIFINDLKTRNNMFGPQPLKRQRNSSRQNSSQQVKQKVVPGTKSGPINSSKFNSGRNDRLLQQIQKGKKTVNANSPDQIQDNEARLMNFLKDAGNLPTHSLINSILTLLGEGPNEPARLGKHEWGHTKSSMADINSSKISVPHRSSMNGIKSTNKIRDMILEQPNRF